MNEILKYFPTKILEKIKDNLINNFSNMEEIRIRVDKPIILKFSNDEKILNYNPSQEEILLIIQNICENSIYSYQNQICKGYITINGGHRIGITGNVVFDNNKVINISYISSLNFRIAKQIKGAADNLLKYVLDVKNNNIYNTIIISPPGGGKTTILRDLIRQISTGIEYINYKPITVGVVDERGEIAAMHKGKCQNDIGIKTDVIDNIPKAIGMEMLIRSMAPQVICADEIGNEKDVQAINYAFCSGIKGIFTMHGNEMNDLQKNRNINKLLDEEIIERLIFLNPYNKGKIKCVYALNEEKNSYILKTL